jgi:hypothetical protein
MEGINAYVNRTPGVKLEIHLYVIQTYSPYLTGSTFRLYYNTGLCCQGNISYSEDRMKPLKNTMHGKNFEEYIKFKEAVLVKGITEVAFGYVATSKTCKRNNFSVHATVLAVRFTYTELLL